MTELDFERSYEIPFDKVFSAAKESLKDLGCEKIQADEKSGEISALKGWTSGKIIGIIITKINSPK